MPVCQSCLLENLPGRDFCECGEYLRWEPTGVHPAPPAPPPPQATKPKLIAPTPPPIVRPRTRSRSGRRRSEPRGGVALSLGIPGEALGAGEAVEVTADAGGEAQIVALVRNRGELTDHYELAVDGIPREWWTTDPQRLLLNPFGSSGDYEGTLTIRLRPPRSAAARAGAWPLKIRAISCETTAAPAVAAALLHVRPFAECTAALSPAVASGRRRGRFTLTVENRGNAPADVDVAPAAGEDDCETTCDPARLTGPPGGRATARVTATPRRQIWIGRAKERPVEAHASPVDAPAPAPCHGRYRQRAWLPWWVPPVALPLAAAALALFLLWPRTATVPDLRGARSPFEAQQRLQQAGLKLDPTERGERSDEAQPGAVIEQSPPAGAEVRRGTAITVLVALGSGLHEIPNVVGKTIAEADSELADHFKLGTWQPEDAEPTDVIRSQWPAAGERRQAGTPVNVTVEMGDAASPGAIPPPKERRGGGETRQQQSGGAPGEALAFDDGRNLFLGVPGEAPEPLSTDGRATEASFTPDGTRIAYMRWTGNQGQIWIFSPGGGDYPGRPLSTRVGDYHRPAVSPDGKAVAFVDQSDGGLCTTPTDGSPEQMWCIQDPRWSYERLSWSADGLLVVARARQAGSADGLVSYQLGAATSAATWRPRPGQARLALRMPDMQHVAAAADGATVAVTSGAPGRPGAVRLLSWQGKRLVPARESLPGIDACEVAFAADGRLTVSTGPCGLGKGRIEVVDADGGRTVVGKGGSPAWQPPSGGDE